MSMAVVTLSREGALLAARMKERFPEAGVYVHESAVSPDAASAEPFSSVMELTGRIFSQYTRLVYIAPCGVVARAIAPWLKHKTVDPAVVVADVGGRWAVSLLSGHEGGANALAVEVGNVLFAEPIITTTTEALKDIIVGVGCRRGTRPEAIRAAVDAALADAGSSIDRVRLMASADVKSQEPGLIRAAEELNVPLRFISSEEIRNSSRAFTESDFVKEKVDLPAVAEPAALLAGRRTRLILPKRIYNGVTVAIAREDCMW